MGRPSRGSRRNQRGCDRARSETVATIVDVVPPERAVAAGDHPAVHVGVRPVRDRPVQVRGERVGRPRAVRGCKQDARAQVVERVRLEQSPNREPASVRREGRIGRPAVGRQDLAGFHGSIGVLGDAARTGGALRVHVHGPDRRPRSQVGLVAAVGGEGDRPPVRVPDDVADAPVAGRDLARDGAGPGVDHEQVRPAVEVPGLIPAPVGPGDAAGARARRVGGAPGGRAVPRAGPGRRPGTVAGRPHEVVDRIDGPHEEPWRVDLGDERDPLPVRRPGDLADRAEPTAAAESGDAAVDGHRGEGRRSVVVERVGADEGERRAVRREPWLAVADHALAERPRSADATTVQRDRDQVAHVFEAAGRAADDDREAAVGAQVELIEHHLAMDVGRSERAFGDHARSG